MSRETENALLLLVGVSAGLITISGAYTRYVKPSLLPWLAISAVLLIALALTSIARDIRTHTDTSANAGHTHRSGALWLLMVPIALLAFVVPPAIGGNAAGTSVREVSTEVLRRTFPPLPAEPAPELSLAEVLVRVAQDSSGTLDNRLIRVVGFTMKEGNTTELGRVIILCCAADAQLARIRIGGPAAAAIAESPEGTWFRIEGRVPPGQSDSTRRTVPVIEVTRTERIETPANPYLY